MPARYPVRDLVVLIAGALLARTIAAWLVPSAPYTDSAYYTLAAEQLATGHGFTLPVLYSFLEVGGTLPPSPHLPVDAFGHWMPLTAIVAAGSMAVFSGLDAWRSGEVAMVVLSVAWVGVAHLVCWDLWRARSWAVVAGVLAIFAGPLLVMQPLVDAFALFGLLGALALWACMRAVRSADRWGWWLVLAGALVGLATLTRIDGLLLAVAVAVAWWPHRSARSALTWGAASAVIALAVLAPWAVRNLEVYGALLPSAGGHTLWITSYNEQFTIGHEVSFSTYLAAGPGLIIGSKLGAALELAGRTLATVGGVFALFFLIGLWRLRRSPDVRPFAAYWVVMFLAMALLFTFHAPKGAFVHSSPAWLPMAFAISVGSVGPVCSSAARWWRFLGRPQTHRFILGASLVGAVVLSLATSVALLVSWRVANDRLGEAAAFLHANVPTDAVVMFADPARLNLLTGNPGVAAPFDPFSVIDDVVRAYDVRWVVITLEPGETRDALGLWDGAASVDATGSSPSFLPIDPAFEGQGVRVYEVVD